MTGTSTAMPSADEIVRLLDLEPHPEGGHYRETFRDTATVASGADSARAASTAIYFLLRAGEVSRWHRVDAAEVWHWYAGAPLALTLADAERPARHPAGPRSCRRRAPASGGAGRRLAAGGKPGRLDAGRLHGRSRLPVRGLRAGAAGLRAGPRRGSVVVFSPRRQRQSRAVHGKLLRRCGSNRCLFPSFVSAAEAIAMARACGRAATQILHGKHEKKCDSLGVVENAQGIWRAVPERGVR